MNDPETQTAHVRALLEPDSAALPAGLAPLMESLRPFTGATMVMMQQTRNEWLSGLPVSQMQNERFATLAWLYMQSAPLAEVRAAIWEPERFRDAVLDWGDRTIENKPVITPEILAAASAIIAHSLNLADAAEFSVLEKKAEKKARVGDESPPPN